LLSPSQRGVQGKNGKRGESHNYLVNVTFPRYWRCRRRFGFPFS
jgi:hypothetical protein